MMALYARASWAPALVPLHPAAALPYGGSCALFAAPIDSLEQPDVFHTHVTSERVQCRNPSLNDDLSPAKLMTSRA